MKHADHRYNRHDFYQTDTSVIVSVYVKGCKAEDVKCAITESALNLDVSEPSPVTSLHVSPLFSGVDSSSSSFKVLGTKVEIKLQKADVGIHWKKLNGEEGELLHDSKQHSMLIAILSDIEGSVASAAASVIPAATASSSSKNGAAPRHHSKWDSFKPEDDGKDEDGGIDDFFKKLYADADDDTRRAMMKSYQESGGTALSTNWSEVGKKKVDTTPPDGMEARKW
jgi:suppressor of G2 allele of SKP1